MWAGHELKATTSVNIWSASFLPGRKEMTQYMKIMGSPGPAKVGHYLSKDLLLAEQENKGK